jgi:hypothetical protein
VPVVSSNSSSDLDDKVIRKNAADLIYYAGLLKIEILQLNVGDVWQNGQVVEHIQPVRVRYPKGYKGTPVQLSNESRDILENHIQYLQQDSRMSSPGTPLFPVASTGARYTEQQFSNLFFRKTVYKTYLEHRESGIRRFAWDLSIKNNTPQTIETQTHQFSRYANIKMTQRVIEEALKGDPQQYDALYWNTCKIGNRLLWLISLKHEEGIKPVLEKLEKNLKSLFVRHRVSAVTIISETLSKAKEGELIVDDKLFPGQKSPTKRRKPKPVRITRKKSRIPPLTP